jgi:bifunctional DNA-binding transcriptional regulator/antitoxin component of YhaV-PrlF toxin-antitoxin module
MVSPIKADPLGVADLNPDGQITVPQEVQEVVFAAGSTGSGVYYWYTYSGSREFVYVADRPSTEDNAERIGSTKVHTDNEDRTTLPKEVRNRAQFRKSDTIHFYAPEGVESEPNPSVAVIPGERVSKIIEKWIDRTDPTQFQRTMTDAGVWSFW